MANSHVYEAAAGFLDGLKTARLREQIKAHSREGARALQFEPSDEEPFYVEISDTETQIGKGKKYAPNLEAGLHITGDGDALKSLFTGEMSLAEGIYSHKIRIAGYRQREPIMVWFSKLLRLGFGINDYK